MTRQWPRSRRKATKADSKSRPSPRSAAPDSARVQLGGRAVEEALAVGEDEQAAAVALGLGDVVGREDDARAALGEAEDELPEALALARVEPGRGLVEQQHGRLGEQADRDVDPLLVAAGQRPDLVVAAVGEGGLGEHLLELLAELLTLDPLEPGEQPQVLGDGQLPVERRLLGDEADLAGELDLARVGLQRAGDDREQRRLAGSVRADDREALTRRGGEADVGERAALAEAALETRHGDRRARRGPLLLRHGGNASGPRSVALAARRPGPANRPI